ncbi:hypothetical protein ACFX19_041852 [Malus domestica]|uniref:uncharacterized protein n=1 Tax=Malus domestica TaxID=3750 RepID=UPI0039751AA9
MNNPMAVAPTKCQMMEEQKRQLGNNNVVNGRYLETNRANMPVFLMKSPPLVSRCLKPDVSSTSASDQQQSSPAVAKLVLSFDPIAEVSEFTMELAATKSENVPKCYAMHVFEDVLPMSVFSESSQGTLSVEGRILQKFDMKPHGENLENYGKLCRERTKKYMKSRKIQVMNNDNGAHMRPRPGMMIGFMSPGASEKKKMPTKGSDMKRTRKDRGEMEDIMFNLFEQKPNRTLRQLIQETNQPEQFLKDILKDLCIYNNKGANQGTYELKPEYRKSVEEPTPD